jgi:hypothetical protein
MRAGPLCLGAPLSLVAACAQILGITDTELAIGGAAGAKTITMDAESGASEAMSPGPAQGGAAGVGPADDSSILVDANARDDAAPRGRDDSASAEASADAPATWTDASFDDDGGDARGCGAACPTDHPSCVDGQCVVRGPGLVHTNSFFVDSTEVTMAEYALFLAAKGNDTSGQPDVCNWNTSYWDPVVPMSQPDTLPVTHVDWCDALAYCTWAGKHLCGHVGGGPVDISQAFNGNVDQWFLACAGANAVTHPNPAAICNNADSGLGMLAPAASFRGCQGFDSGVFDLEGNAAEWIDSCNSTRGAADTCYLMGGSYADQPTACNVTYGYPRNTRDARFGFRCCGG